MTTQTKVKATDFKVEGRLNGLPYGTFRPNPNSGSYGSPLDEDNLGDQFPEIKGFASGAPSEGGGFDGYHRPVLDIDWPVALMESETPGHHHLIIDKGMSGAQYLKLLEVLCEVGIIEKGYLGAAKERGCTVVALEPWKSQHKKED